LIFTGRTWPLFGRVLLVGLCQYYIVVPTPWANTSFYRWSVHHIALPNGKPVGFVGKPGDIWYVFILLALCALAGNIHWSLQLLALPLMALFEWMIMRWFFANLVRPFGAAAIHRRLLGTARLDGAHRVGDIDDRRLGLGDDGHDALGLPARRRLQRAIDLRRQRLGRFVAHVAVRPVLRPAHSDPVDAALVFRLIGGAISPDRAGLSGEMRGACAEQRRPGVKPTAPIAFSTRTPDAASFRYGTLAGPSGNKGVWWWGEWRGVR
jgi:hypothetical protein